MLAALKVDSLEVLVQQTVPESIHLPQPLMLPEPLDEPGALKELRSMAATNRRTTCFIGQGFHPCVVPSVIRRNILENPGWYTQYTPYQAEIAQGRLEALLNFQTLIADLTGLPVAGASLLDEASAAAEAMTVCWRARSRRSQADVFLVTDRIHPQVLKVLETRALPLGIRVATAPLSAMEPTADVFGVLVQTPDTDGTVHDYRDLTELAHAAGAKVVAATDPLAMAMYAPPGEMGADVACGTTQRLGMGPGLGGPHAAFIAVRDELKRLMPGRMVGVARDASGQLALRLALQTREQHIRREKATSNICTAQVLPAVVASMYAVYHGPEGIASIAAEIHRKACTLRRQLEVAGARVCRGPIFDTVKILDMPDRSLDAVWEDSQQQGISLRRYADGALGISMYEGVSPDELDRLHAALGVAPHRSISDLPVVPAHLSRASKYLTHPVFHMYRSEAELTRYMARLQKRDLSLTDAMIPLGSCTMKLNPTASLEAVTWPEFAETHPFEPPCNQEGYRALTEQLCAWLVEITGFAGVSLQPNAGSQGELAGLLAIRWYLHSIGQTHRSVCLIPASAHGTNPASAQLAGFQVVVIACDKQGNIDLEDLQQKLDEHGPHIAALMITYPSTHGVFEESVKTVTELIHGCGGQVYVDGANMNAMVGLSSPAAIGGDVCHLNLHKTFCIPHGGGGPGMGPVCAADHLVPFLPSDPVGEPATETTGAVAATDCGSGAILPVSWTYIRMMGAAGLTKATQTAILAANYIADRLGGYYPILFKGQNGRVAHECIIDLEWLKPAGLTVDDVAKRLIDYGFHAPTVSWPVPFTMMIEPTESESLRELDRFCDAMIRIHGEIQDVLEGRFAVEDSLLRHAPFTAEILATEDWPHQFSRRQAVFPAQGSTESKFWPSVSRIDNVWGDRNFMCVCPPLSEYQ